MGNLLEIGMITKTHGLKGMMKATSYLVGKYPIKEGDELIIVQNSQNIPWIARAFIAKKGHFFLKLEGIDTVETAQKLIGASVWLSKDRLSPLEEGEYYWADLIGLGVVTETGELLGQIDEIFPTGSNDVYVCRNAGTERFLPGRVDVVKEIDLVKKLMVVRLPAGM